MGNTSSTKSLKPVKSVKSLHEGLIRERDERQQLDDIFDVLEEIGQGGLCKIYKIRKKDEKIGGSSRPEHVVRKGFLKKLGPRKSISSREFENNLPLFYALKVINLNLVNADKIDQLKNEVEILKTLDHKNIIKAYETFQMKDIKKLMIVMELCTGGDLLARTPYTQPYAAHVTRQLLSAINYLHSKNIAHRDIKCENILFESEHPDAAIKVIDFGLSKAYSPTSHILTERVGTLYSMSPETMLGTYTYSADLWSIGICCYMMLAGGHKPFNGKTPKQLVANILTGTYSFPDDTWGGISQSAKDFIKRLLVVDPQDRMTTQQAMEHPWLKEASRHISEHSIDEAFKQRVAEGIIAYAACGEFRKLALNVIAKKSTASELYQLRQVFDDFDTQNTGTLTLSEFKDALAKFNYTQEEIEQIFAKIDVNRNNVINYTEFLAATLEVQGSIEEYRLAEAFDLIDRDDTGYISRENLRQILGQNSNEEYIDQLIAEADFRRDGKISYEEFLQVFNRSKKEQVRGIYESGSDEDQSDEVLRRYGILEGLRRRFSSASSLLHRETSSSSFASRHSISRGLSHGSPLSRRQKSYGSRSDVRESNDDNE